ncbi:hypothetical protein BCR44DRAFT_1430802, partial [Catenaria anguillulae PL171]
MSSSTTSPAPSTPTSTSTAAVPVPSPDTTARLVALPNSSNNKAVSDLFPILAPQDSSSGLPVPAVCHLSPADGTAITPCPLPSAQVWDSLNSCVNANCQGSRSNNSGTTSRTSGEDLAEIQAEECALRSCRDQFIAASANLCLPLSAQVLQEAKVYLPRLPSSAANDSTFAPLHAQHLAAVGQQSPSPPSNGSTVPAPGSLGICVTTIPIGTPCDPNNDYTAISAQGSSCRPAIFPKAMIAYTRPRDASSLTPSTPVFSTDQSFIFAPGAGTDQQRPPLLLRHMPTESGQRIDPRPTLGPSSTGCTFNAQCRHSLSCGRADTCAALPPASWSPVAYLGNDAQDWLASEQRARASQFTLQLVVVGVVSVLWCLHTCRARVFRAWVSVNRKLALQPASNLMLDELGEGGSRRDRLGDRGMVDEELGVVVLEGEDALPQYQPPGAGATMDREDRVGVAVESIPPPPVFTSVPPGASGPATTGESVGPMEASLATAELVEGS